METKAIDCNEVCTNGCIQPESCQNQAQVESTSKFISETSLDRMLEMAEEARRKKISAPPQWVIPDWDS